MACPVAAIKWVKRPKLKARPLQEGYPQVSRVVVGGGGVLVRGRVASLVVESPPLPDPPSFSFSNQTHTINSQNPIHHHTKQRLQENVYAAGVPSHKLFGGMGYLIKGEGGRMKGRNILVDTPDADPALVEAIRAMGGLEYMGAWVLGL